MKCVTFGVNPGTHFLSIAATLRSSMLFPRLRVSLIRRNWLTQTDVVRDEMVGVTPFDLMISTEARCKHVATAFNLRWMNFAAWALTVFWQVFRLLAAGGGAAQVDGALSNPTVAAPTSVRTTVPLIPRMVRAASILDMRFMVPPYRRRTARTRSRIPAGLSALLRMLGC